MPQFVLAFPLNVASDEPFKVTDFVSIDKDTANVIIPGCGVQFNVVRQAAGESNTEPVYPAPEEVHR